MADIELVIKISKEKYRDIQSHDWRNAGRWFSEEWTAIHNGIPLPKGHGRLIDADELYGSLEFPTQQFALSFKQVLNDAPTIIEADKAESEVQE